MREGEAQVVATLLGDLVGSRSARDRAAVHARLRAALTRVNDLIGPETPLRVTAGDEFQGTFAHLGQALHAGLLLRLDLAPVTDIRLGFGWGEVTLLDATQDTQDGPGWWAARAAIEWVGRTEEQPPTRAVRTAYRRAEGTGGPDPHAVNAALLCRDQVMGSLDERSMRILRGLITDVTQNDIAHAEGISASAVSQRVRRDGLGILVAAAAELEGVR